LPDLSRLAASPGGEALMPRGAHHGDPSYRAFVDALREVLGLDPLYDTKTRPDVVRFYREPFVERAERAPRRAS
jgi:hypothetical protein